MADDAVPFDEMRWDRLQNDPIDAVLSGAPLDEDLFDVAAIIHDMRSTYLPVEPLRRRPALAAFIEAPLDAAGDPRAMAESSAIRSAARTAPHTSHAERIGRKRHEMLSAVSSFVATLTGKVVLATAVTAASVGALHATDAVDVPILPDNDGPAAHEQVENGNGDGPGGPADAGAQGQQTAAEKQAAAQAYADAVQEWTDCVAESAAAQGVEETRTTGAFDPRDACGEHPMPDDFGLTELPSQAFDAAGVGGVEDTPGAAVAPDDPTSQDPTQGGTTTPAPDDPTSQDPPQGGTTTPAPDDPTSHDPTPGGTTTPAGG
jgi:hypothetical protein